MPEYQTIVLRDRLADATAGAAARSGTRDPAGLSRQASLVRDEGPGVARGARCALIVALPHADQELLLAEIETETQGGTARWLLPLAIAWEDRPTGPLPAQLALARVRRGARVGLLTDGFALPEFASAVLTGLASARERPAGEIRFEPTSRMAEIAVPPDVEMKWLSVEQSNSSMIVGDVAMLKMFRRVVGRPASRGGDGPLPDRAGLRQHRATAGRGRARRSPTANAHALAIAQGFIRNQGDAWTWTLDLLMRGLSDLTARTEEAQATEAEQHEDYGAIATLLGRRLGEMHAVLAARSIDPAFAPEQRGRDVGDAMGRAGRAAACRGVRRARCGEGMGRRSGAGSRPSSWRSANAWRDGARAGRCRSRHDADAHSWRSASRSGAGGERRCLHHRLRGRAGQAGGAAPGKESPAARRRRHDPLVRLRGRGGEAQESSQATRMSPTRSAMLSCERSSSARRNASLPVTAKCFPAEDAAAEQDLLRLFLIEKAAYEIAYEAANRPTWIDVPLHGLAQLTQLLGDEVPA